MLLSTCPESCLAPGGSLLVCVIVVYFKNLVIIHIFYMLPLAQISGTVCFGGDGALVSK